MADKAAMSGLAGIVKGLTKAQREWLAKQQATLEPIEVEPCAEWWDCPPLYVTINGDDYWLAMQSMTSPEGASTFTSGVTKLTPLGLAVRSALMKEKAL